MRCTCLARNSRSPLLPLEDTQRSAGQRLDLPATRSSLLPSTRSSTSNGEDREPPLLPCLSGAYNEWSLPFEGQLFDHFNFFFSPGQIWIWIFLGMGFFTRCVAPLLALRLVSSYTLLPGSARLFPGAARASCRQGRCALSLRPSYRVAPESARAGASAPRFDTFCDALVGQWLPLRASEGAAIIIAQTNSIVKRIRMAGVRIRLTSAPRAGAEGVDVEEVMRACGGAVQGIKDRGYYHNRGNDG